MTFSSGTDPLLALKSRIVRNYDVSQGLTCVTNPTLVVFKLQKKKNPYNASTFPLTSGNL